MALLGSLFGSKKKERSLAGIKRRAKVGINITLVSTQLKGSDMPLPDDIKGIPRKIRAVHPDGVTFDSNGPGGLEKSTLFWPSEPQEGFLGMIASPHGILAGFVDDDTFVVDDMLTYNIYRIGD